MKKVMIALCFMFGGVVVVNAQQDQQDTTSNQYRTEQQSQYPQDAQSQDRERIQATELPDEVKRTLEGEEYRGWLISGAFKSTGSADQTSMESDTTSTGTPNEPSINATESQGEEVYIVELKNGAETKTLRFDSNGQKLDEGDNSQNSQFNQNEQMNQDQMNQRDQMNQNDRMDQPTPNDQSLDVDPNETEQPGQSQTPGDQQSSDQATQPQPDQSTETQTDQSRANESR